MRPDNQSIYIYNALNDPSVHNAIIDAAHEAFSGLEDLYTALYPLQASQMKYHVTRLDQKILQQQIDWLCRVLATRGMPTIMMEQTLYLLTEELSAAVPEKRTTYKKLDISAAQLKKAREGRILAKTFQSLADEFDQSVGSDLAVKYRNTGMLLVSAVSDEANGIDGTIDALCGWLTDTERFSAEWIRAVKNTVGKAKNQLNK